MKFMRFSSKRLTVFAVDRDWFSVSVYLIKNKWMHSKLTSSPTRWQMEIIVSSETDWVRWLSFSFMIRIPSNLCLMQNIEPYFLPWILDPCSTSKTSPWRINISLPESARMAWNRAASRTARGSIFLLNGFEEVALSIGTKAHPMVGASTYGIRQLRYWQITQQ